MDNPTIPLMQIRPGCLLLYDMSYYNYLGSRPQYENDKHIKPEKIAYSGKMNQKSKSRLRFSINLLVAQAKWKERFNEKTSKFYKFKVNFITLTLSAPQKSVTDRTIKSKMLAPWIRNMRNVYGLRSYVWRAERQKNGNLHFHISSDTFIPYEAIRDAWNLQQGKFHFITDFQNKNHSVFPNSTDVHGTFDIQNLASYMVKYMLKDEKGLNSIDGKVWDCSTNLKLKDRVCFEMSASDFSLINNICQHYPSRIHKTENCTIINLSDREMSKCLPDDYFQSYTEWIDRVYEAGQPPRYYRI